MSIAFRFRPFRPGSRRNPRYLVQRLATRLYERRYREQPWIARGAIRFCEAHLTAEMAGFEWGSGHSTLWFGRRLKSLISIEPDPGWHVRISHWLTEAALNHVRCRFVPLDHDLAEPTPATYPVVPAYVAAVMPLSDASLDFVMVDGHYRQACVIAAIPKIRPGGYLLIDDAQWLPESEWNVPADWPVVHRSADRWRRKSTSIWQKPRSTER